MNDTALKTVGMFQVDRLDRQDIIVLFYALELILTIISVSCTADKVGALWFPGYIHFLSIVQIHPLKIYLDYLSAMKAET